MKKLFEKFSRRTWIIIGVIIAAVVAVIAFSSRGEEAVAYQTEPIERGSLVATVGATGSVRAKQSATLIWQTTGIVDAVNVGVGDRVAHDDVLREGRRNAADRGPRASQEAIR